MQTLISQIRKHLSSAFQLLPAAVLATVVSAPLAAQTSTSTIEGTVSDPSGALLAGAQVEIKGETVGRTVSTDDRGAYRAVGLPPGRYAVIASKERFQTARVDVVDVAVNRTATIHLRLEVGRQTESVVVAAPAWTLDPTRSAVSHGIAARDIESIPLNGRNFLDLVLLTPGVITSVTRTELADRDTRGAIFGDRGGNSLFLIDGFENNDDVRGGVFHNYTQDAIQEFEVISAGYKAEFGRGSGGVINVITKTGTNTARGTGAFFLRDDALDSSNRPNESAPELARYNTSIVLGGPVTENRAWYFGSLEHLFERREALYPLTLPDVLRAREDFSTHPQSDFERAFGKYTRALANGQDLRTELAWSREWLSNQPSSTTALPSSTNDLLTKSTLLGIGHRFAARHDMLVDSAFTYRGQGFDENADLGDGLGANVAIGNSTSYDVGPRFNNRQSLDQRYFTGRSTASLFAGNHAFKAGAEYMYTWVNGTNAPALVNAISTTAPNFAQYGVESFGIAQGYAFINPGDELTRLRNHGVSLFAQDDWHVRAVTLNLGTRWDYDARFNDPNNVSPRLGAAWSIDERTVARASWGLYYDRYRLGLAQAVPELGGFNSHTVVEYNYPRLAADTIAGVLGAAAKNAADPFLYHKYFNLDPSAVITRSNVQALTGLTPDQFLAAIRTLANDGKNAIDFSPFTGYLRQDVSATFQDQIRAARPFKTPFNNTVTVGLERRLTGSVTAEATFVARAFRNILGVREPNLKFESRTTGRAATTDNGPLQRSYGPWFDGEYKALVLGLSRPYDGRYQWQVSYTYARGTDNLLNPNLAIGVATQGAGSAPTDNLNLEFDRGRSDLLTPHVVVASGSVNLPANVIASGVLRGTSGTFFSASSPSSPKDYDGDGIRSSRPIGTVRNQFIGPKSFNVDARLEKRIAIGRYTASGLVEFFNLFNADNPRTIQNTYVNGAPVADFGTALVPFPGREAQFGVRLSF